MGRHLGIPAAPHQQAHLVRAARAGERMRGGRRGLLRPPLHHLPVRKLVRTARIWWGGTDVRTVRSDPRCHSRVLGAIWGGHNLAVGRQLAAVRRSPLRTLVLQSRSARAQRTTSGGNGATVFVHPAQPPMPLLPGTPAPLADYVFDTTRTALNLVLNGVMSRYPNLRVILSHGGGFLPYAAYRFSGLASTVDRERNAEDLLRDLKRFYFDTALSASPSALPALLAFAEPGHVLYGSDWPFAPQDAGTYYNHYLETYPDYAPGQAEAIDRGNAEALFPRLVR
ncbi:amidohydrolase family protein [Streptomyces antimycoticus]|uniref:amidohydrolase family protein n=1 Tax=Streptomyces antimycoticus TaxID=68175 RepID=UPI00341169A2